MVTLHIWKEIANANVHLEKREMECGYISFLTFLVLERVENDTTGR